MKRLLFPSILLIVLIVVFASCKDSKNDDDIDDKLPNAEYLKYLENHLKLAGFELQNNVKTAERIYYDNLKWGENETIINKSAREKAIRHFDKNGALIQVEYFSLSQEWTETGMSDRQLMPVHTSSYTYDEKYRLLENIANEYLTGTQKTHSTQIATYAYDDVNKKATVIVYIINGETKTLLNKSVYPLDKDGRIDENIVTEFTPKEKKSGEEKPEFTVQKITVQKRDSKGNIILWYYKEQNSIEGTKLPFGCEVQKIIYHDGTESSGSVSDNITASTGKNYIVNTASGLNGKVKSIKEYSSFKYTSWDASSNTVSQSRPLAMTEYDYASDGGRTAIKSYEDKDYSNEERFRTNWSFNYEYDKNFRITSQLHGYYSYDAPYDEIPIAIINNKDIIIYDDINKKGTILSYSYKGNTMPETPSSKKIYNLTGDGTIDEYYYESHKTKTTITMPNLDEDSFNKYPASEAKQIEIKDNLGNWVEKYSLKEHYDLAGDLKSIEVVNYRKREIAYY